MGQPARSEKISGAAAKAVHTGDEAEILKRTVRDNDFIPWDPSAVQARFLLLPQREALYGGQAGPGKTVALLMGALQFVHIPNYSALLLRRTFSQLKYAGSLIPLSHQWLDSTPAQYTGSDHTWTFPSGATVSFGHLQYEKDKRDYKSARFHYVGFDEASDFTPTQIKFLLSRIRRTKDFPVRPRIRLASNPGGPAHEFLRDRYVKSEQHLPAEMQEYGFLPASLDDNPYIEKEEYRETLAELDPVTRRRLLRGDWDVAYEGEMFKRSWFNVVEKYNRNKVVEVVRYWDLAATSGGGSYTVGLKMAKTSDGNFIVLDVVRGQWSAGRRDRIIQTQAQIDDSHVEYRFEQEAGSGGKKQVEDLQNQISGRATSKYHPTGEKPIRAAPFSSAAESGNVYLYAGEAGDDWIAPYLDEITRFPEGENDDQVDASSGAYNYLNIEQSRKIQVM